MANRKPRIDVHAEISNQIIEMLEAATSICECPWYRTGASERPSNATTGKRYQGINVIALWASSMKRGYTSGLWATYRQWASIGAQVKRSEKGTRSVFYKTLAKEDADGSEVTIPFARSKAVFAAEQVDGFELPDIPQTNSVESVAAVDELVIAAGAVPTRNPIQMTADCENAEICGGTCKNDTEQSRSKRLSRGVPTESVTSCGLRKPVARRRPMPTVFRY